ncbi:MAG TPA: serine/threonine-protein phosphatase [Actinobacteria bacterium]|nr:serine/threonine-protein phosphatase [Actinomycetota bacterium]
MNYTWATRTDVGRVRQQNEDSVLPDAGSDRSGEHLVAAVADGMGGAAGGEIASATAIASVAAVSAEVAIRIEAANLAVIEAASRRPRLKGMGTTLTLGIFHEDGHLQIGHVGDSRAYLLRDGLLTQVTTDHSFVSEMLASGRMTAAEAEVHPYRSVLTRVVGLEAGVEVEVLDIELAAGDRVLICSDGITTMIDDAAILAAMAGATDPGDAAEALIAAANAAGGVDNISAVVVDAG